MTTLNTCAHTHSQRKERERHYIYSQLDKFLVSFNQQPLPQINNRSAETFRTNKAHIHAGISSPLPFLKKLIFLPISHNWNPGIRLNKGKSASNPMIVGTGTSYSWTRELHRRRSKKTEAALEPVRPAASTSTSGIAAPPLMLVVGASV